MAQAGKITEAMRLRIHEVARARLAIPGDRELAQEAGVSVRAIQHEMRKLRMLEVDVRRETCTIPPCPSLQVSR